MNRDWLLQRSTWTFLAVRNFPLYSRGNFFFTLSPHNETLLAKTAVSPRSSETFREEERLSNRNSILMTENLSGIRSGALIGRRCSYIVLAIVYEWQTKDKRPQRSNVNAKNLYKNSQYLWNIVFSGRSIWVLLELVRKWTQHFTKIDQEKRKIEQNYIWNPMTTGLIMQTSIYVISMEFLSLSRKRSFSRNVPSGEERGQTAVFAG